MVGYFGRNCLVMCFYFLYGVNCKGICDCYKDLCDVFVGCIFCIIGKNYY